MCDGVADIDGCSWSVESGRAGKIEFVATTADSATSLHASSTAAEGVVCVGGRDGREWDGDGSERGECRMADVVSAGTVVTVVV